MILAPIAASFALGLEPRVAQLLPSTRYFWDGLEKYNRMGSLRRPPTAFDTSAGGKNKQEVWELASQDTTAVTSSQILNYYALTANRESSAWKQHARQIWPDAYESRFLDAKRDLQLKPLGRYLNVSLAEAERLISEKANAMIASRTNSWCSIDMTYPNKIYVGEFIYYFTTIWPDCVLFKGGTRWRPRDDGYEKGAVYLCSPEDYSAGCVTIACIGKASLLHAWIPLMAACSLLIDPDVAAQTKAFAPFWESVGSSYASRRRLPNPYTAGRFVCESFVSNPWTTEPDPMFEFENELCTKLFYHNLHLLTHTNGFWSGGEALPGVSLSRNDFVDWAFLWEPDALVESVGRFRVRPVYLEKGGLGVEKGGAYFSVQTSNDPVLSMLIMLSAVQAGVPPAIAALCKFADPFWDFALARTSEEQVERRRDQLRQLRAFQMAQPTDRPHVPPMSSDQSFASERTTPSLGVPVRTPPTYTNDHTLEPAEVAAALRDTTVLVNSKVHTFELCDYRSLVVHFEGKTDGHYVAELEERIKEAGGGLVSGEMTEVDGDQVLILIPIVGKYQVQLKLTSNLGLSVAIREIPGRSSAPQVLANILVAVFMVKRPLDILHAVRALVDGRLRKC